MFPTSHEDCIFSSFILLIFQILFVIYVMYVFNLILYVSLVLAHAKLVHLPNASCLEHVIWNIIRLVYFYLLSKAVLKLYVTLPRFFVLYIMHVCNLTYIWLLTTNLYSPYAYSPIFVWYFDMICGSPSPAFFRSTWSEPAHYVTAWLYKKNNTRKLLPYSW